MRKYLLISHGGLAEGMVNTLNLFLGELNPFKAISAFMSDVSVDTLIEQFMATVDEDDELVILSDLLGGSVNQKMMPYMSRPKTYLIAGFNLPMVLQLSVLPQDVNLNEDLLAELIDKSKESLVLVNRYQAQKNSDDE